ncbi:MAG: aminoacyl-tRNA hydrolase [Phycisphaerae bacterium]|nr:aminoacyl-tRNA hydrolase [Phycisphaerae bacterium]
MKLIAGLGNPGTDYDGTRHNVGFMVLDALGRTFGVAIKRRKFNALAAEVMYGDHKLLLLKPQQYMNCSGHSIATAAGFYKLQPEDVLVVADDMAMPTGQLRLRAKGSAGGHNGLKDIIAALGTQQFPRLRVGIGSAGSRDAVDYVLSRFTEQQCQTVDQAVATAANAVLCWVTDGIETAMTRYNVRTETEQERQDV